MATMGACRLLLVCVFCTLWGGAVILATELSSAGGKNSYLLQKAQEGAAGAGGEKAVKAQEAVVTSLTTFSEVYKEVVKNSNPTKGDDVTNLKNAVKEVEKLQTAATTLNNTAQKVTEAVEEASTGEGPAKLWEKAKEEANKQLELTTKLLSDVKKAKEEADKEQKAFETESEDAKKPKAKAALTKLKEDLKGIATEEGKLGDLAQKAKEAIEQAAQKATNGANLKKPEDELSQGSQQHLGSSEGTGNQTTNDDKNNKETENTTPNKSEGDNTSTGGLIGKDSTSSSTHEDNTPDGAHGGAIATCTAAPLLLLLTAVAYAAMC